MERKKGLNWKIYYEASESWHKSQTDQEAQEFQLHSVKEWSWVKSKNKT